MSTQQRRDVFAGRRKKTSGGLVRADLIKNKRGKIVSRKKSDQAGSQNNLGSWLREKGKKIEKGQMLRKKSMPPADAKVSKQAGPKKAKPKPAAPKKAVPKPAAPKQAAAPKKKAAVVRKKPEAKPKKKKLKTKPGINPLTQQPYDKKSSSGYVEKGAVSLDNVKRHKRRRGQKGISDFSSVGAGW